MEPQQQVAVRVYFNTGYGGTYQEIPAGTKRNLNSTLKNNNASHKFGPFASLHQDVVRALQGHPVAA